MNHRKNIFLVRQTARFFSETACAFTGRRAAEAMRENHAAQLIEPDERERGEPSTAAKAEPEAETSGHEIKPAISHWVRKHEHRSEEFARAFKDLLTDEGFISSQVSERAGNARE